MPRLPTTAIGHFKCASRAQYVSAWHIGEASRTERTPGVRQPSSPSPPLSDGKPDSRRKNCVWVLSQVKSQPVTSPTPSPHSKTQVRMDPDDSGTWGFLRRAGLLSRFAHHWRIGRSRVAGSEAASRPESPGQRALFRLTSQDQERTPILSSGSRRRLGGPLIKPAHRCGLTVQFEPVKKSDNVRV